MRHPVKTALADVSRMRAEAPPVNPALLDFIGETTTQGIDVKFVLLGFIGTTQEGTEGTNVKSAPT